MEWFRQAIWACKYWAADMQADIMEATRGTPLMPRDWQVMIMSGRAFTLGMDDGRLIYPMAFVTDVSESIDAIGQVPGDIIARGPKLWERVPGGDLGFVLTSNGPSALPSWKPAAGGSAGGRFGGMTGILQNSADNQAYATKGYAVTVRQKVAVDAVMCSINPALTTQQFKAQLATVNLATGQIVQVLGTGDVITPGATGIRWVRLTFPTPIVLEVGWNVAILTINHTGGGTASVALIGQSQAFLNAPLTVNFTQWRYNTIGVTDGQAASATSAGGMYQAIPEGALM